MSQSVMPNLGFIDRQRIKNGWTWSMLASAAGISSTTRTKLRCGRPVSIRVLRRIAESLDVRFAEIVRLPDLKDEEAPGERVALAVGG